MFVAVSICLSATSHAFTDIAVAHSALARQIVKIYFRSSSCDKHRPWCSAGAHLDAA